jgi:mRNA-degrading endonuclease RelE of RelBE toxin-antitoxin system
VRFVETPVFTREVTELLSDDEYRGLQLALLFRPEQGAVIARSGGLRKIRWKRTGEGKRGGLRVIYFWDKDGETIYMLLVYPKSEQEDLTPKQLRMLSKLVREELK